MMVRIATISVLAALAAFIAEFVPLQENALDQTFGKTTAISTAPSPTQIPDKYLLKNEYHIFQSFNNCGPASLSMALSYYGINKSQEELGQALRPWQNPEGIQDDKSVTLQELADKGKEFNLIPYHRPNGSIELLEQFVAAGFPVITRTWLNANEDIGHYRVIKGYDTQAKTIVQDDSFQDKNLTYTYDEFNEIWEKFNYEYLVFVPEEKQQLAERILGKNTSSTFAWQQARDASIAAIKKDPSNIYHYFNLSVAYYNLKSYKESVTTFEKVSDQLPYRMLWYQIEPLLAYYELGDYDNVFAITDSILNGENSAFSELYLLRGNIYIKQGNTDAARVEYEKAVYYNTNLNPAKEALNAIQ